MISNFSRMFALRTTITVLVLSSCLFSTFRQVQAATTFTNAGAGSSIVEPANWDNGVPDNSGNSGTVPTEFYVTNLAGDPGIHTLDSKDISFEGSSTLISPSNGVKTENSTLTFQGSSAWAQAGAIAIGRDQADENGAISPAGATTLNIAGNAAVIAEGDVKISRGQNASVNQTGGIFATGNGFGTAAEKDGLEIGKASKGGVGTYTLSGGSVFALGQTGILMQNGSLFTISGGEVTTTAIGITANGGGTIDFTAGSTGSLTVMQDSFDFAALVPIQELNQQ